MRRFDSKGRGRVVNRIYQPVSLLLLRCLQQRQLRGNTSIRFGCMFAGEAKGWWEGKK